MKPVFADTSFYVGLLNPRDQIHHLAVHSASRFSRVVTSEYVLVELSNFQTSPINRAVFIALVQELRNDPSTVIVPSTSAIFQRGQELFAKRLDKEWSLTDCISFDIMADHQLTHALTADHHFVQAGFTIEFP
jgi:predicted nucleic acid-binding protein